MDKCVNRFVVLMGCVALAASAANACDKAGSCADPTRGPANAEAKGKIAGPTGNRATSGGVRVAVGDVNGDGAAANGANRLGVIVAPAQKPQTLLLPAVQKVREAAAR